MSSNRSNKKLCTEMNNSKMYDQTFTPRDYQIEILERAMEINTIACLGTGTGKTFIAVMLIRECSDDVYVPFEEGGKRIFFLVPTVPLVHQQQQTISKQTNLEVKGYSGDMNVDSWNRDKWQQEFVQNQVLVMTAEIFRIILDHVFITPERIQLIIIDECHRAQGDHPYRQAMKCLIDKETNKIPKILGLSASLINGKCKPIHLEKELQDLEKTLFSSITTVSDIVDLQRYGADPEEFLVYYQQYVIDTDLFNEIGKIRNIMSSEKQNLGRGSEYQMDADLAFFDKPLRCLNSLEVTLAKLGAWCALKAAEIFKEELSTLLLKSSTTMLTEAQIRILEDLKSFLDTFMLKCQALDIQMNRENIEKWPSKLKRLLDIFIAVKNSRKFKTQSKDVEQNSHFVDNSVKDQICQKSEGTEIKCDAQICAIIFVEQRITAYVLQQWILEIKRFFPELDFLMPDFVVGHGSTGIKRTCMSERQQKKALKDFRDKKCNILISTCVLEEGMDVQQCNIVIRFDLPPDFRAYVQSKGRARAKNSIYIMMSEVGPKAELFWYDLLNFKTVEKMLLRKCRDRPLPEEEEVFEHMSDSLLPPYMPRGPTGPRITLVSAISVINRYCASLPADMATKLTAKWSLKTVDTDAPEKQYECTIRMPINSSLRKPITGERMRQKKAAKMAAALKACQLLDEMGEFNEYLVPISCLVDQALEEEIGETMEEDGDGAIPGTNRRRQVYCKKVPVFLQNCLPRPMSPCFLHVFKMELVEPLAPSLNPRKRPIFKPDDHSRGLGMLLAKRLPKVNSFPVFTKSGKVKVSVVCCEQPLQLSDTQLQRVSKFHQFLFKKGLQLDEGKSFEPDLAGCSFFIVPVNKDLHCNWSMDWDFIQHTENHKHKKSNIVSVGNEKFPVELYKDCVLLKTYSVEMEWENKLTCHHAIKVLKNKCPTSQLDKEMTFMMYYQSKYNIDIKDKKQPLVETYQDAILHRWKPLYVCAKETFDDLTLLSKTKQRRLKYREYLVPELCLIHAFPSSFYQKVLCLPTMLFRLNSLLLAEELRQKVASAGLVGTTEEFEWPYFDLETSDKDLKKHLAAKGEYIPLPTYHLIPQDIEKCVDSVKITSFVRKVDLQTHPGPSPSLILQALTSKSTGDEFDLERLEMIGDSFLKYAMSVKIYIKYHKFDEGKLTRLRSQLIQNYNLYRLSKKKNLPEHLICNAFSCRDTWLPPCYVVEEENVTVSNRKTKSEGEIFEQKFTFFGKQIVSDKCVADSVEALIGAYLLSCGQKGALMFMYWLGLNPFPEKVNSNLNITDFENWPPEPPNPIVNDMVDVNNHINKLCKGFEKLEKNIGYKFKNRALLLQAFTHPSYIYNEVTDCYQRLEFLGDAVLDFLITRQLYEDPNDHSPGKLTDLRSALVNNIYFASLAVKYEYNKHLKMLSPRLTTLMLRYLDIYAESGAEKFFEEHGYLEEIECFELDEVEVPKALGDLFESVAGAIFLDSGMSLDTVWNVVYPMIEPALHHLTKHVPLSPVRELYEILKEKNIFVEERKEGKTYMTVTLKSGEKFVGVGPNKKVAKRSVAKRVLAKLNAKMEE